MIPTKNSCFFDSTVFSKYHLKFDENSAYVEFNRNDHNVKFESMVTHATRNFAICDYFPVVKSN